MLGGGRSHHVAGPGVAVYRVDPPGAPDDLCEGHRHVSTACSYVDALPPGFDAETFERDGERAAVDVVAKRPEHRRCLRHMRACHASKLPMMMAASTCTHGMRR